jgi:ComF family protein
MEKIINTIFPPRCVFCGALGDVFCDNCISTCNILKEQRCLICDRPSTDGKTHKYHFSLGVSPLRPNNRLRENSRAFQSSNAVVKANIKNYARKYPSQLISPFIYEKNVRECIRKSKYSSRLFSCLKRLSFEGVNIVFEWGYSFDDFVVVPIPVSKQREKLRGFNQADIISKIFAVRFGLVADHSILIRTKDKHAQHSLSRQDRFSNIKGSFVSNEKVKGKKVLLVDDICTTGATFLEASKVLFENGALDVKCFSLSKKL